jgi:hypothetical protein
MTYVQFDEIENVLASLDLIATLAPLVKKRRHRSQWKWLIIGAHDALQGALVCAIADSTRTNVLSEKSARKMLEWLEDRSKDYPGEFLANFGSLMKRAAIEISTMDAKDLKKLHFLRNELSHFTPKGWSIELAGLPRLIDVALKLVERLMQSERVNLHMSGNRKRRVSENARITRAAFGIRA